MRYINKKDLCNVAHYLGIIMQGVGISLLIPLAVAAIYNENTYLAFMVPSLISLGTGSILRKVCLTRGIVRLKHGMMVSSLAWLWASLMGGLVMVIYLNMPFVDAFFENISAWTGSGLTMFPDVEILPKSILFLRSLEEWIGGLGIVVIVIGVLVHSGTAAARLYESEARDERIKPSVANTLRKIFQIYLIFTILGIVLFIVAGMPIFDAVNNTFTAISTGGMSIYNLNMGAYNNNIFYLISMFLMLIGATSFLTYYRAFKTKGIAIFKDIQFQAMIAIITISSLSLYFITDLVPIDVVFHVISAVTTTGANIDSNTIIGEWPEFMRIIIIMLMLIGGAAGSTVGAIKLVRIITIIKGVYLTIISIISPKGRIIDMRLSDHEIRESEIREASSYTVLYLLFIFFGWLLMGFYGYDALNSLFEITSAQGNVGLSTGITSANLPLGAKIMIIFNMWIGRLEIIPVLVILRSVFEIFKGVVPSRKNY